ncbi:MAG: hypothetical protein L6Q57_07940 [Alphaproteobacteria bacterium]|nr:hypothetical protein [Alphaproteobacteria bacterium]
MQSRQTTIVSDSKIMTRASHLLELTRDRLFIEGRCDIFDVLARQARTSASHEAPPSH